MKAHLKIAFFIFPLSFNTILIACNPASESTSKKIKPKDINNAKNCISEKSECPSSGTVKPISDGLTQAKDWLIGQLPLADSSPGLSLAPTAKSSLESDLASKDTSYREGFYSANKKLISSTDLTLAALDKNDETSICNGAKSIVGKLEEMDKLFSEYKDLRLAFIYAKFYINASEIISLMPCK